MGGCEGGLSFLGVVKGTVFDNMNIKADGKETERMAGVRGWLGGDRSRNGAVLTWRPIVAKIGDHEFVVFQSQIHVESS